MSMIWRRYYYMEQISTHEIRTNLTIIFDRINHNHEVMFVKRNKTQSVVLLDANDYNSLMETLYLLQNPANAERLYKGIEQHRQGQVREIDVKAYVD
jgi:antitoxin YefM